MNTKIKKLKKGKSTYSHLKSSKATSGRYKKVANSKHIKNSKISSRSKHAKKIKLNKANNKVKLKISGKNEKSTKIIKKKNYNLKRIKQKQSDKDKEYYSGPASRIYKKLNIVETMKAEAKENARFKKAPPLASYTPEQVSAAINLIKSNEAVKEYLTKNVSSLTLAIMDELKFPNTDDSIAAKLNIKVNSVRRVLNILQNYGITNYYIAKNTNGWLSFSWYINVDKIPTFIDSMITKEEKMGKTQIDKNCNDYFICPTCYKETKIIFPFDTAFENNFRCTFCSNKLESIDKEEIEKEMNDGQKE
jgi:transcription factor E